MDIKMECESVLNLCQGCLSGERNIQHVSGEFSELFYRLRNHDENQLASEQLLLCWECVTILLKLKTFQNRIQKAQVLLLEHVTNYCITGKTVELSCLSSLTKMQNYPIIKFYEEENLNNEEQSSSKLNKINDTIDTLNERPKRKLNKINNLNDKTDTSKERSNCKLNRVKDEINLNKDTEEVNEVKDISSSMNTEDLCPEEENKDIELKLEDEDIIKQEADDSEDEGMDCSDMNYKEDDSTDGSSTDNYEPKLKASATKNNTLISKNKKINSRRKYMSCVTITRNEGISVRNAKKIYQKIILSQEEYEDLVLKKERDRLKNNNRQFHCEECKARFLKNIDLLRHNSFVHNTSAYPQKCLACKTMIRSKEFLPKHWTIAHTVMFRCKLCSDLQRSEMNLKRHIATYHLNTYTCNTCGFVCSTFIEFRRHYKSHEVVTCDYCGRNATSKSSLIRHIKCTHSPITCTICNRICVNKNRFKYHILMEHPELTKMDTSKELSYCVECDKQFPNVFKYKMHLTNTAKHNNRSKRVPCPECGKIYSSTFLDRHYRFAHLKVTKHYCDKCNKYYAERNGLVEHIKRFHEKIPIPKNKFCDLCGRGFGTNRILQNHRRTHTGEKPYKCDYCPASFAQIAARNTHQKTQHKPDKLIKIVN